MTPDRTHSALTRWFRSCSLRTWLIVGMMVAFLPVMIMAIIVYTTYHNRIAEPFRSVINAQHRVLVPLERIQGELWDISLNVVDYAQEGSESYRSEFEAIEREVAVHLSELERAINDYGSYRSILDGVEQQLAEMIDAAAQVQPGDSSSADSAIHRFEDAIVDVAHRLESIAEGIRQENEKSHAEALAAMQRVQTYAIVASLLTLLFGGAAIQIIDRALINSTDELVAGAMSITAGDRTREIDVQVPPELAAVANAFNVMTKQIIFQENALAAAASTDGLTGLHNRREFDRVLAEKIDAARETGVGFALLMLDVDHFKKFNDSHGHLAGDEALRQVARSLVGIARAGDHTFRYGGEEFAVILLGAAADGARQAAERTRQAVEHASVTLPGGKHATLTVSIGVVVHEAAAPQSEIVELADRALYNAKAAGRNTVRFADPVGT